MFSIGQAGPCLGNFRLLRKLVTLFGPFKLVGKRRQVSARFSPFSHRLQQGHGLKPFCEPAQASVQANGEPDLHTDRANPHAG